MQSKSSQIYRGIAIFLFAVAFMGLRLMKFEHRMEERRLAANETPIVRDAELTVRGRAYHDQKQVDAIRSGMNFKEVLKAVHIIRIRDKIASVMMHENVTVRFMNPDNSSLDVVLKDGYVVSRRLLSTMENRVEETQPAPTPEDDEE